MTMPKKSSLKQSYNRYVDNPHRHSLLRLGIHLLDPEVLDFEHTEKSLLCSCDKSLRRKLMRNIYRQNSTYRWVIFLWIRPDENSSSSSIKCWLKGFDDKQAAEEFVADWNEQRILGSRIDCDCEGRSGGIV